MWTKAKEAAMKQILKDQIVTIGLPDDSYPEQDVEFTEIFTEEMDEILVELAPLIDQWLVQPGDTTVLGDIRRHFHTIKGSGRMVGAKSSAELAWVVEDILNRVLAETLSLNPQIQTFVKSVHQIYSNHLISDFKEKRLHQFDLRPFMVLGQKLLQSTHLDAEWIEFLETALSNQPAHGPENLEDEWVEQSVDSTFDRDAEEILCAETFSIFQDEAIEHLLAIDEFVKEQHPSNEHYNAMIRALHTLRGSSSMAHVEHIHEASAKLENQFKKRLQTNKELCGEEFSILTYYTEFVRDYLYHLKQDTPVEQLALIYLNFNQLLEKYQFQDDQDDQHFKPQCLVATLIEMNINSLLNVEEDFERLAQSESVQAYLKLLVGQTEIVLQHSGHQAVMGLYQFTQRLGQSYQALLDQPQLLTDARIFEFYHPIHQTFIQYFDVLAAGQRLDFQSAHQQMFVELEKYIQQVNVVNHVEPLAENVLNATYEQSHNHLQDERLTEIAKAIVSDRQHWLNEPVYANTFDPDLLSIFLEEADELLVNLDEELNHLQAEPNNTDALKHLMRYLHTLKGGANMVQADHIGLIAHELESIYQRIIQQYLEPTPHLIAALRLVQDEISDRIQTMRTEKYDYIATNLIHALKDLSIIHHPAMLSQSTKESIIETDIQSRGRGLSAHVDLSEAFQLDRQQASLETTRITFDQDLLQIFLDEADELLISIEQDFNAWLDSQSDTLNLRHLMRHLHTLKGNANMVQATQIGLLAHELESIYQKLIQQHLQTNAKLVQVLHAVHDDIVERIHVIRQQHKDYSASHTLAVLHQLNVQNFEWSDTGDVAQATEKQNENIESVEFGQEPDNPIEIDDALKFHSIEPFEITENIAVESSNEEHQLQTIVKSTFMEEAAELLQQASVLLNQWFDQRDNRSLLLQLQRNAHSLKGGARMAGLDRIADIAYELENAFEHFGIYHFNSMIYDHVLSSALTWLRRAIFENDDQQYDQMKHYFGQMVFTDKMLLMPDQSDAPEKIIDEYRIAFVEGDGTEPPSMHGEWEQRADLDQANEMVRVSASILEKMINLSGENSINRSRIEMDLGQMGNTLTEMEQAIRRLADQLRRMEGELESQIIAKHGNDVSRYSDFDPLEMDQYSSLNQLSKSLAESASDLVDFKNTLSEKIKDTEGLLLQQSRIQVEIQESLMRTRLVPFSRLLPRLQRIVRQTASTLDRPTELIVQNTEGELDRSILEKLISPFEHMLRNAIDHGIETSEKRLKVGKPLTGRIELNITRQGTDIVISFSDDGQGIDVREVQRKAIQSQLIAADQQIEQDEILQFIFHPGLSTASQVTQISGRGVGLDVVQSEIKALGGDVSVSTVRGRGTTFTIRVPTTVSVSDALMVKVGDQQFAIPLAHIERIVRISPAALEQYFDGSSDIFKIDQRPYRLRYLSEFVSGQSVPRLHGIVHSLPVLLIKGHQGQTVALLIDQIIGSRGQIVVKPIGQQFASIGIIAGATILGDGQVCLILDGQNIARQIQSKHRKKQNIHQSKQQRDDQRQLIMIVDDSVTVRKVTSRLLERQGYDVITAKDGVDAMEQLETVRPDLMLLDIEMPRMDGFEVTNLVRHHELHQHLPIIMITSRTGEKHRDRALSLGVNQYMGKPFQEDDLVKNVALLLASEGVKDE